MKYKTKILLSGLLLLPAFFGPAIVQAQSRETSDGANSTTLEQRLETRKQTLQTQVNALERVAIQARCKASQAHLSRLQARILGVSVKRKAVYDPLISRLADLGQKLEAKGVDTAEYDQQINELSAKISEFYTALDAYEQTVNDLATMDCAADPEGYKASLEEARTFRVEAVQAAQVVHNYLQESTKPALQAIHRQLTEDHGTQEGDDHGE